MFLLALFHHKLFFKGPEKRTTDCKLTSGMALRWIIAMCRDYPISRVINIFSLLQNTGSWQRCYCFVGSFKSSLRLLQIFVFQNKQLSKIRSVKKQEYLMVSMMSSCRFFRDRRLTTPPCPVTRPRHLNNQFPYYLGRQNLNVKLLGIRSKGTDVDYQLSIQFIYWTAIPNSIKTKGFPSA